MTTNYRALSYLRILCEEIDNVEVVKAFNDPSLFLKAIPDLSFNCCILDIQMPEFSGLEVAEHLQGKLIIFTTAYKDFAAEAYDLNAVDYVRKPIQKDRLQKALSKAKQLLPEDELQVIWNTDKGKTRVHLNKIQYITSSETDSRDKLVYFIDGTKILLKNSSFDHLLKVLPKGKFCRINKKDIIAIRTVLHFTSEEITTSIRLKGSSDLILPLSDVYREEFRRLLG